MTTLIRRAERADAQRNRLKVLDTAERLFAERGTSVTLGEVAAAAGVGAGTVYRHFPTKEALMATVLDHRTELLAERGRTLRSELPPGEAFLEFVRHVAEQALANQALCQSLASRDEWQAPMKTEGRCLVDSPLAALLEDAQLAGAIRDDLDVEDARALMLGVVAMAQALNSPDRTRRLTDTLWTSLIPTSERNSPPRDETSMRTDFRNETAAPASNETVHRCPVCSDPIASAGTGRPPKYCSPACRQKAFRDKKKAAAPAPTPQER